MACKNPCDQCVQSGVPILFTRYAAAYSCTEKGAAALEKLKPGGNFRSQPGGVALQTAQYNVRMLRAGYLYIRIETNCRRPAWFGYAVHSHGYLTRFDVDHPNEAEGLAACSPQDWGANRSLVWIKGARDVTKLNYLFHPDPVDPDHLNSVIDKDLDKYTQSFDVASWINGRKAAPDTAVPTPDAGGWNVAEFKALKDEVVRNALDPQLYGLMGGNAVERGWGDHEDTRTVDAPSYTAMGDYAGAYPTTETVTIRQPDYAGAHGKRLQNIAKLLADNGGAIVACEDAIGIAQELGHLQAEAQTIYSHWQASSATGHHKDVSNEWVFQTAVGAQGLIALAQQGAVARVDRGYAESARIRAPLPRDPQEAAKESALRGAARAANHHRELGNARSAIQLACNQWFDQAAARDILQEQKIRQGQAQDKVAALGRDQNKWVFSSTLLAALGRFSNQDGKINKPGGGAALSLHLAQCLSGLETHEAGRQALLAMSPWGGSLLSRVLCFNSATLQAAYKNLENGKLPGPSIPAPDPETAMADALATSLKLVAGRLALGDKALGFIDEANKADAPAMLRKAAWAGHVFSLLSVRAATGIGGLKASQLEARMVQHLALAGMSTMGSTVHKAVAQLQTDVAENAKRIALRAKKLESIADPATRAGKAAALERARGAAPGTRTAMLGALMDLGAAVIKGNQLGAKLDARSAFDLAGQLLQGIGSLYDWRAKVYEETIFNGVKGYDVYKYAAHREGLDSINALHLKSLRVTAFKFLGPAAMFSVVLDGMDAWRSGERGQRGLATAQAASAFGAIFTVLGTGAAIFGVGSLAWAAAAATLGLAGAVLSIVGTIFVLFLSEDKWITWLRDIPLNKQRKGKKPIHDNLRDTLQELASAQGKLQPA
ncbi:T6SS effector BTH_I2691 family protein [Variovorax boronicumulans]|uniref:T6SS effector BTH_I2691 family protein n=1 Tax=Variovorax boronicumulans TaxID=436515 RepID=UPI003396605A